MMNRDSDPGMLTAYKDFLCDTNLLDSRKISEAVAVLYLEGGFDRHFTDEEASHQIDYWLGHVCVSSISTTKKVEAAFRAVYFAGRKNALRRNAFK